MVNLDFYHRSLEPQGVAYGYFFECEISDFKEDFTTYYTTPLGFQQHQIFFDFVHLIIFFEIEDFTER